MPIQTPRDMPSWRALRWTHCMPCRPRAGSSTDGAHRAFGHLGLIGWPVFRCRPTLQTCAGRGPSVLGAIVLTRIAPLLLVFFLSGATALIYEVLWTRQ